jgi:hypothetical protein
MNMKFYQEFLTVVEAVKMQKDMGGKEIIERGNKPLPAEDKSYYISTDFDRTLGNLELSKVFDIDDDIKVLLLNTTPPKDSALLKLPFRSIFIDINITKEEAELDATDEEIKGLLVIEREVVSDSGRHEGRVFNVLYRTESANEKGRYVYLDEAIFSVEEGSPVRFRYGISPKTAKVLQQFVYNFILFMNQPEIERIEVYRTPEQNAKRVSRGKRALPEVTTCIRLTGKLKEYVNSIRTQIHMPYSYRFWVRGHFRTLRSDVWRMKKGMKIWIMPFIKGEGILVDKRYTLLSEKDFEPEGVLSEDSSAEESSKEDLNTVS